jgi:pimeloyl-ACP methyl ester carboxylesterase
VDAEDAASLLADGAHLVGHSYGALGCLLAAARHPDAVRSLTVIEPPAFALAADDPAVARVVDRLAALWRDGRELTPDAFRAGFLRALGLTASPGVRLKPAAAEAVRAAMSERPPWEAEIPLDALAAAPFPRLVVCGAWDTAPAPAQDLGRAAFAAVARVLTQRAGARLAVLAGAAHNPQRLGAPFNELLEPIVAGAALGAS